MEKIHNPVLRGFNPDPSILRVGENYYIATSTFQWFPGVQIHYSKDLVHWKFLCRPLDCKRLLDLTGVPDSGGVWAPCLTYDGGIFYLVYSIVRTFKNYYKDVDNYLTMAENIEGPWSDPIYLNSSGFDASMFHDTDGRKYLMNQLFDHRDKQNQFLGIVLQEYDSVRKCLKGKPEIIFRGSKLGITEGPHIYKVDQYYYLICAEGGTFYKHAVTIARSRQLCGPYEIYPDNPILTSYGNPELELQKSGHASLVQTEDGQFYMAHLCARPSDNRRCMLGRETAIQKLERTDDGWFRLEGGGNAPRMEVPGLPHKKQMESRPKIRKNFENGLPEEFQSLREPMDPNWIYFKQNNKSMVLIGRTSMESMHYQSLVGRRREDFYFVAETALVFEPGNFQQMAGIAVYYDTMNYAYLNLSFDEKEGRFLQLLECDQGVITQKGYAAIEQNMVRMRIKANKDQAEFFWSTDGKAFCRIGPDLDITHMSDDYYIEEIMGLRFTGTFIALCCQDISGQKKEAEFMYFDYQGYDTI